MTVQSRVPWVARRRLPPVPGSFSRREPLFGLRDTLARESHQQPEQLRTGVGWASEFAIVESNCFLGEEAVETHQSSTGLERMGDVGG